MSGAKKKLERRASLAEMGLTEKQKQELKEQQAKRRNTILATVAGVVAVVLVVALLVWYSGVIPRHTTALTVKDHKYTVADMDYYYNVTLNSIYSQQQFYVQIGMEYPYPMDPSGDLRTQYTDAEQTQSYYDYLIEQATSMVTHYTALYDAAKAEGYTMSEDARAQLDASLADLDATARRYGFASTSAYLKAAYGRNMTEKVYRKNVEMVTLADDYESATTAALADYPDEELQAYYAENSAALDTYEYSYVYFDGSAPTTDADGNAVEPTEEASAAALAEAKAKAEAMVDALAADSETTFSAAATAQGGYASSVSNLGTAFASMPYSDWLTDGARKDGDVDFFEVEGTGYYVVQFRSRALYDEPTVDVRHILASFEAEEGVEHERDEFGQIIYTDAEKQAAHDNAAAWLEAYNAGEKTAEAFGQLAEDNSGDGRKDDGTLSAAGGLYEGVRKGEMVQPFEDWCFDASRQEGDTGLVETSFGWHVMYYQSFHRPAWMDAAASAKSAVEVEAFEERIEEGYEAVKGAGMAQVGLS